MPLRTWAPWAFVILAGCATSADSVEPPRVPAPEAPPPRAAAPEPPPAPVPPVEAPRRAIAEAPPDDDKPAADPFADVGFKEVNQKDWVAALREKLTRQEKVPATDLRVSPGLLRAAFVRSPPVASVKPGHRAPQRRHQIVVVDNQGRTLATFRPVTAPHGDEPPKNLRFLSEDRLLYEVVEPPPEAQPEGKPTPRKPRHAALHAGPRSKKAPESPHLAVSPLPPPRTFVIQPLAPRARPIRCVGAHFTFTHDKDRLAFVSGSAAAGFVAVDGAQVYPRRGRTVLASAPVWSKDGHSLAFLEAPAAGPARLVLLAELDNPTGDTTWELPPTAPLVGALVFWAGSEKLVVGKTQMRPVFSASFTKETTSR